MKYERAGTPIGDDDLRTGASGTSQMHSLHALVLRNRAERSRAERAGRVVGATMPSLPPWHGRPEKLAHVAKGLGGDEFIVRIADRGPASVYIGNNAWDIFFAGHDLAIPVACLPEVFNELRVQLRSQGSDFEIEGPYDEPLARELIPIFDVSRFDATSRIVPGIVSWRAGAKLTLEAPDKSVGAVRLELEKVRELCVYGRVYLFIDRAVSADIVRLPKRIYGNGVLRVYSWREADSVWGFQRVCIGENYGNSGRSE